MANPPFNVDDVPIAIVEADARFNTYGIPRKKTKTKKSEAGKETVANANYLWINLFASSLKEGAGRAARSWLTRLPMHGTVKPIFAKA